MATQERVVAISSWSVGGRGEERKRSSSSRWIFCRDGKPWSDLDSAPFFFSRPARPGEKLGKAREEEVGEATRTFNWKLSIGAVCRL